MKAGEPWPSGALASCVPTSAAFLFQLQIDIPLFMCSGNQRSCRHAEALGVKKVPGAKQTLTSASENRSFSTVKTQPRSLPLSHCRCRERRASTLLLTEPIPSSGMASSPHPPPPHPHASLKILLLPASPVPRGITRLSLMHKQRSLWP